MKPFRSPVHDRLALGAFLVAACVIVVTAGDYGIAWDEPGLWSYANEASDYFRSGFADRDVFAMGNHHYYGTLFIVPIEFLVDLTGVSPWYFFKLATAMVGLLGVWAAWALARVIAGSRAALWTVLLLLTLQSYYGHGFINPKDIPFAAAYAWTTLCIGRVVAGLPGIHPRDWIVLGLALGCALGIRVGGVMLVGYLVLLAAGTTLVARRALPPAGVATPAQLQIGHLVWPVLSLALAYLVMIATWPAALESPFRFPFEALRKSLEFKDLKSWVLFRGEFVRDVDLPASYLLVYLTRKLPLFFMAASLAGLVVALRAALDRATDHESRWYLTTLLLAVLFPQLYYALRTPVSYDAIRHFLFLLPLLAVLGGVGIHWVLARLAATGSRGHAIAMTACIAGIALQAVSLVRLHPYQYVHYGELAGGLRGADGAFELDYWATSFRELGPAVADHALSAGVGNGSVPLKLYVCGPKGTFLPYFTYPYPSELVRDPGSADYMVLLNRWGCLRKAGGAVAIATVEVDGVVLSAAHAN